MSNQYLDVAVQSIVNHEVNKVLTEIRADIKKLYRDRPNSYNHPQRTELYVGVLAIIDKYIGKENGND